VPTTSLSVANALASSAAAAAGTIAFDLTTMMMMMMMVLFCLSKRTSLLNGLGFSGTSY
jgi:hypothetical protein